MDIYYEKVGKGYPLILLHGNGETHHIFDQLVEQLSQKYQCILIDLRYHGKSVHSGPLTYQYMCQDVLNIIECLNIKEYDVIGFSDGAIIGLMMAMQKTGIKHFVCIGANTRPHMIKNIYRYSMYLRMFCLLPFCIYNAKARLQMRLTKLMLQEPCISYDELKKIHIPVLVLAGEMDMIKEEDTKMIAQSLPFSVLKIIPHANHFLLSDSYQKTMHEISMFLKACHKDDIYESM